jgi:hypothetical protein
MKKLLILTPCLLYLLISNFYQKEFSALVCLRTTTDKGNPVAGVEVKDKKKYLGCSDSFGEWCSHLKTKESNEINLSLTKKAINLDTQVEIKLPYQDKENLDKISKTIIIYPKDQEQEQKKEVSIKTAWIKLDDFSKRTKHLQLLSKLKKHYLKKGYKLDPESKKQILITNQQTKNSFAVIISGANNKKKVLKFNSNTPQKKILTLIKKYL